MISEKIKQVIKEESNTILKNNPLFIAAEQGRVSREISIKYINNLLYFAQHTPYHLKLAYQRAIDTGSYSLAEFMLEKIKEENGHDEWAKNDLRSLSSNPAVDQKKITPSLQLFLDYAKELIQRDPSLFLSYIICCEYFTVIASPTFLSNLEKYCDIPKTAMSVVGNHEELDKGHVDDDIEIINKIIRDNQHEKELLDTAVHSMRTIDAFLSECLECVH